MDEERPSSPLQIIIIIIIQIIPTTISTAPVEIETRAITEGSRPLPPSFSLLFLFS
ncbi:hypothetical protein BDV40DRAFT_263867 [Aspergillus tamarii]|uniref:Uncharacterized protein n=1 Tax=Aspergillus tamarii TaxID=41984 RepID=A0A5N6UWT8_ASPTM|nr:hypothetical protein BDV40DRAFT_263867 [Aspergillus tamarii]